MGSLLLFTFRGRWGTVSSVTANAQFIHPLESQEGDARALKITGLKGGDALVFLDASDGVRRVVHEGRETPHAPWPVQQVLIDLLDPHAALALE